jgi:hypothetical protein
MLVHGIAEFARKLTIQFAGIAIHSSNDFCGEKCRNHAVIVSGPDIAIPTQEASASTLFSDEAERAVTKTVERRRYSQPLRLKYQYTPAPANTIDSNDSG